MWHMIFILIKIVVISLVWCVSVYWNTNKITAIQNCAWKIDETLQVYVDTFSDKNNNVILKGWCLKEEENIGYANYNIVVHGLYSDKYYQIRTGYTRRDDVTEVYDDGYNYGNSGFYVNIVKENLPSDRYEICLWYCVNNNNSFKKLNLFFNVE